MRAKVKKLLSAFLLIFNKLEFDENDEQGEQNERFDQRETKDHNRLNTTGCRRVASRAFDRPRADFALT